MARTKLKRFDASALIEHKDAVDTIAQAHQVFIKGVFGRLVAGENHAYPQKQLNFLLDSSSDFLKVHDFEKALKTVFSSANGFYTPSIESMSESALKASAGDTAKDFSQDDYKLILDYVKSNPWSTFGNHVKELQDQNASERSTAHTKQ